MSHVNLSRSEVSERVSGSGVMTSERAVKRSKPPPSVSVKIPLGHLTSSTTPCGTAYG